MKVVLDRLPQTFEEFSAMPQMDLTCSSSVCAMLLCALKLYLTDQEAGVRAMDVLRGPHPMSPYDVQFLQDRLRDKPYLPTAYFFGASPENNYVPHQPYVLDVSPDPRPQDVEAGYMRVFLTTGGADGPRPIKLRRKDGKLYLWEYSSVLSGIRLPASENAWL